MDFVGGAGVTQSMLQAAFGFVAVERGEVYVGCIESASFNEMEHTEKEKPTLVWSILKNSPSGIKIAQHRQIS